MSNQPENNAVRQIDVSLVRPLRHKILRPNQPPEACIYPNDNAINARHFGAYENNILIGIASIYSEPLPEKADAESWRIRGMATEESARGKGYGDLLLNACLTYAYEEGGNCIWCNARTAVAGFYGKFGFSPFGEEFDLPGIGPHYLMIKKIDK